MSGAPNEDVVRRVLLASNRGDVEEFLGLLHPEVEWHSVGLFLHPARAWRGRDALRAGMRDRVAHHGGHPQVTLQELISEGERVFAAAAVAIPAARRPMMLPIAWIFELREGKVTRVETFASASLGRQEWQRRAG